MGLRREVVKVKLTFIDVESDKAEGTLVDAAIHADIGALHEAHVNIEEQTARSGALDLGSANEAIEVGHR